jgi:hypothetical protein
LAVLAGGWCTNSITRHYGVSLWKHVRWGWDTFSSFASFEVGDGSLTKFWHNMWCGGHPLKESFVELFCHARNRDALVADLKTFSNDVVHWDISFIRLVHDWKVDLVSSFFNVLYSARLCQGADDKLCWTPSKGRSFEFKSFYKVLPKCLLIFPLKEQFGGLRLR